MRSFTKLSKITLALSLALFGGASSLSALAMATEPNLELHEKHVVMVEINGDENANIRVEVNGEVTDVIVPKIVLHDRVKLAEALSELPVEVREQLLSDLGNIHLGDKMIKVHKFDGQSDVNWVSEDGEHIVIIESDSVEGNHTVDIKQMVKRLKHRISDKNTFVIKHDVKMKPDMLLSLIKDADFSPEELDQIQQAIDEKR
ncbi:MAG: hypothetical protein MJK12_13250 [Colwellia sp.]|nr:hypothetical protein [Colwellia sp.]